MIEGHSHQSGDNWLFSSFRQMPRVPYNNDIWNLIIGSFCILLSDFIIISYSDSFPN